MSKKLVTFPFEDLVLYHDEIGLHRGREHGFAAVFGYASLHQLPFVKLAKKVRLAYLGERSPAHEGWPAQRAALQWLVDRGKDAMYAIKDPLRVMRGWNGSYYLTHGNHRSLALYILGETSVRVSMGR